MVGQVQSFGTQLGRPDYVRLGLLVWGETLRQLYVKFDLLV